MEKPKTNEPTFPAPMIVGSGLGGEQAGAFRLSLLDWILRGEEVSLLFPIEGEISNWIKELWAKPIQANFWGIAQCEERRHIGKKTLLLSPYISAS